MVRPPRLAETADPFTGLHIQRTHRHTELRRCRARNLDTDKIAGITTSAALQLVQSAVMLRLLLLWLPGQIHTGRLQQTTHELVTNTARQAINVRLYIITIKTHDDYRLTLEARMLAELLRHVGGKLVVDPVLQ